MKPWRPSSEREYRELPLVAHDLLAAIPFHDAWRVSLVAPKSECSMLDVRRVSEALSTRGDAGVAVSALFAIRRAAGRFLGWDAADPTQQPRGVVHIPEAFRNASLVVPGTCDGPFRVAYVLEHEALSEISNKTVEAYVVWALRANETRCDLFFAIHVRPTSRWTPLYLAVIAPFRRFIVYPSLLARFHREWHRDLGAAA